MEGKGEQGTTGGGGGGEEMEEKIDSHEEDLRAASLLEAGGGASTSAVSDDQEMGDMSSRRFLPRGRGSSARRKREDSSDRSSESSESSESSKSSDEEDKGPRTYTFDPVTEYMIKHGRQNAHLDAAWDFYARFTLPKYTRDEGNSGRKYRLQEAGEDGGEFYNTWKTPLSQLGDFGLGVGLYFQTLAVMGVVFLLAGLANTWAILDFRSEGYSGGQDEVQEQISRGSAACTLRQVVCLDSFCTTWSQDHRPCHIDLRAALIDVLTIIALFMVLLCLGKAQNAWAKKLDLAEQTASDYSVVVEDPDPTDVRPGSWKKFFQSRFGHVTYVTTAVNCGRLVDLLSKRFAILEKIRVEAEGQEEENIAKDTDAVMSRERWPASYCKLCLMKVGLATDIVYWHEKLVVVSQQIKNELGTKTCAKVFVTFEKEVSQRKCLKAMTTGYLMSSANRQLIGSSSDLMRNNNVLSVTHAPEPDDVIWQNLEYGFSRRLSEFLGRVLITVAIMAVVTYIIFELSEVNAVAAATFIAINNTVLPKLMAFISEKLGGGEHHHTHSTFQASLMLKMVIVQWMNTAFIIYFVHGISTAPNEEYMNQVSKILWADAFTQPLVKVLDFPNRLKQYILAPFAKTQAKMNSYFMGSKVSMAERYASMLKTIFVCVFFSAIFPQGYYVASMAMFMTYWSSKYCLFNRWKRQPAINDSLTILTRRYLAIALVIHVMVSLQFYAGWPFDGFCETGELVTQDFADEASVDFTATPQYNLSSVFPTVGDPVYEYCDQDSPLIWGEAPEDWMPDDQFLTVWVYSVFGYVVTCVVGLALFGTSIWSSLRRLCAGVYRPVGKAKTTGFTEVEQINAYVPEVPYSKSVHPLLAADIRKVDAHHISWTGDYQAYNLCTPGLLPGLSREARAAQFSRVVFYPPSNEPVDGPSTPTRKRCMVM